MSEEHWCQKCWLTKRTTYVKPYGANLCDSCFDFLVKKDLQDLLDKGVITK